MIWEPFLGLSWIDILGPLESSKAGSKFILVVTAGASHYIQVVELRSITVMSVTHALMDIFAYVGFPLVLSSDRAPQFTSRVFQKICELVGVHQIFSTPYDTQSHGVVERSNQKFYR